MAILTIAAVGIVSIIYMFGFQWIVERLGLIKGSLVHDVGSFTIPEPFRSPVFGAVMHLLAGLIFTGVYAFVFNFLHPVTIPHFMEYGVLIGLVHGTLVTFFGMMGFSSSHEGLDEVHPSLFVAGALNIVAHVIFGMLAGLGFGYTAYRGSPLWFTAYGVLIAAVVGSLLYLILPKRGPSLFEVERAKRRQELMAATRRP